MIQFLKAVLRAGKKRYLYFKRIVFAKNSFKISPLARAKALKYGSFTPKEYALFNLAKNDPREYLSRYDAIKARYLNSPFNQLLNNPIVAREAFRHYHRTQTIYARIKKDNVIESYSDDIVDFSDILTLLDKQDLLFRKTHRRRKWLIQKRGNEYLINGIPSIREEVESLIVQFSNYYIMEYIEPHGYAKQWSDSDQNTVKIIAMRDPETNEFGVYFAMQNIRYNQEEFDGLDELEGENGVELDDDEMTDDFTENKLTAKVDVNTGVIGVAKSLETGKSYSKYPNGKDGKIIKGVKIPHWKKITKTIVESSEQFPYLQLISYTIVVTKDSFTMVNVKSSTEYTTMQLWGGQRNTALGKLLKQNKIIKEDAHGQKTT